MHLPMTLNFRDLGGTPLADGSGTLPSRLYMRSGKLCILSPEKCKRLSKEHNISCIIDLRTPHEAEEFPDPIPEGVEYLQIPLLTDAVIGITHETGSDPIEVLKKLRHDPAKLQAMMPDMDALYKRLVTDDYSCQQTAKVIEKIRENAGQGKGTLIHCTAGKDRTGVVFLKLMRELGVSDELILQDYLSTNRNVFLSTLKKCIGVYLLTRNIPLVRYAFRCFMADRKVFVNTMSETTSIVS